MPPFLIKSSSACPLPLVGVHVGAGTCFGPADGSAWGTASCPALRPTESDLQHHPPVWESGKQILTYSIRLNICLGQKSESGVYLEMGRRFVLLHLQNSVNLEFTSSETLFLPVGEVSCPGSGSAFRALPVLGMHPFIHNSSDNAGLGIYCHGALSGLGILFAGSLSYFLPAAQLQRAPGTDFNSEQVPRAPWPWTRGRGPCRLGI